MTEQPLTRHEYAELRIRRRLAALEKEKRAQWKDYTDWLEGKVHGERKPKFAESELAEIPGLKAVLAILEGID